MCHIGINDGIGLGSAPFIRHATLLVPFFFALSGFVLAYRYKAGFRFRGFILARAIRIYPLHLFALALILAPYVIKLVLARTFNTSFHIPVASFFAHLSPKVLGANILLLNNISKYICSYSINMPSWSLSVEMLLYLIFGLILLLSSRRPSRVCCFIILFILGGLILLFPAGRTSVFLTTFIYPRVFEGIVCFFAGTLCFYLYDKWQPLTRASFLTASVLELILLILAFILVSDKNILSDNGLGIGMVGYALLFAALIFVFAHERGAASRVLGANILVYLGALSYSIYLLHLVLAGYLSTFIHNIDRLFDISFIESGRLVTDSTFLKSLDLIFYICVIVAISSLTYRYVELGSSRILKRYFRV